MKLSYKQWYSKLEAACNRKTGLGLDDLPDADFTGMYEDGYSVAGALRSVLEDAGF